MYVNKVGVIARVGFSTHANCRRCWKSKHYNEWKGASDVCTILSFFFLFCLEILTNEPTVGGLIDRSMDRLFDCLIGDRIGKNMHAKKALANCKMRNTDPHTHKHTGARNLKRKAFDLVFLFFFFYNVREVLIK